MHYGAEHTRGARASDAWTYRGLPVVILENELLRCVILAGKGADVYSLVHKPSDTELMFRTPGGVRNPSLYVPTTSSGTWIDHYEGGWQTVFPAGGNFPQSYRGAELGQHGEANLMPWDATVVSEGPETATAEFFVRTARSPLVARKTVSITAGVCVLKHRVQITNTGAGATDMVYGEHIAFGPPFLAPGCVIDLPGGVANSHHVAQPGNRFIAGQSRPWPEGVLAGGDVADLSKVPGPDTGAADQHYISDMPDGWYAVTNPELGLGVAVRYPRDVFGYLWYWQEFGGTSGFPWWGRGYNIGLEPFTSYPNEGLAASIANGSAWRLEESETLVAETTVSVFQSSGGVEQVNEDGTVITRGR